MNDIQKMAATAALKKMIRDGRISICTIDKILEMTGGIAPREEYEILHTLHCVSFTDMEPELVRGLPLILDKVLSADSFDVDTATMFNGKVISVHKSLTN